MIANKPRRSEWANAARQILRQYNEGVYHEWKFLGPHYVAYDRGEFILQPFGRLPTIATRSSAVRRLCRGKMSRCGFLR